MIKYILTIVFLISQLQSKKTALLVFSNGFEDLELVTITDVLKRAKVEVTLAFVGKKGSRFARGMNGLRIKSDLYFK